MSRNEDHVGVLRRMRDLRVRHPLVNQRSKDDEEIAALNYALKLAADAPPQANEQGEG